MATINWEVDKNEHIEIQREKIKLEFDSLDELDEFLDDLGDARNEIADQIHGDAGDDT